MTGSSTGSSKRRCFSAAHSRRGRPAQLPFTMAIADRLSRKLWPVMADPVGGHCGCFGNLTGRDRPAHADAPRYQCEPASADDGAGHRRHLQMDAQSTLQRGTLVMLGIAIVSRAGLAVVAHYSERAAVAFRRGQTRGAIPGAKIRRSISPLQIECRALRFENLNDET